MKNFKHITKILSCSKLIQSVTNMSSRQDLKILGHSTKEFGLLSDFIDEKKKKQIIEKEKNLKINSTGIHAWHGICSNKMDAVHTA